MHNVNHPFIVKMHYVYQKNHRIYFVMDYIGGGELFKHIQEKRRFTESQAKFIMAQVVLAIGYLHKEMNVIYRDLKPENIIFDEDGYVKLTDFGLAKQGDFSTTFCGTPEYVSPEMLSGKGHDKATDWWAVGVLTYELLAGIPPFYDNDTNQMYKNITGGGILWPMLDENGFEFSKAAQDFIIRLLNRDPKKRLGSKNDATEVLGHKFFTGINIDKVLKRQFKAPYYPLKLGLDQNDIA